MSSTTLIANLIEEEALLRSVSVVSSLTHAQRGFLAEVMVPRMLQFSNEDGVLIGGAAAGQRDHCPPLIAGAMWKWPTTRRCCIRGQAAIVVADEDVLDDVRLAFRGL